MSTEFTVGGDWRLSAAAVRAACAGSGRFWRDIDVVPRTGSTNADMLETARRGAPEGTVLVAEAQTAGRGRLGRSWVTSPGAALTFSVLLRPAAVPAGRRGWMPLLTGDSVACGVRQEYLRLSATVGRDVRVSLPGGRMLSGTATGIDDAGRLLVAVAGNTGARNAGAGEVTAVSAGDVIHIR